MPGIIRRVGHARICAVGWGVFLFGCTATPPSEQRSLPYQLHVVAHSKLQNPSSYYKFADLDGSEGAEIISISSSGAKSTLRFHRQFNAPPLNQFEFAGRLIPDSSPLDLDGDGNKEYFICEQRRDSSALYAIWPFAENRRQKLYAVPNPVDSIAANSVSIHVRDLIKIGDDGEEALILYLTAKMGRPSSLIAWNWKTRKRHWNQKLTGSLHDYFTRKRAAAPAEILLTTTGGGSNLRLPGQLALSDKESYLISLNSESGAVEHVRALGPSFTKTALYSAAELNLSPARRPSEWDEQLLLVASLPDRSGVLEVWNARERRSIRQLQIPDLQWHFLADVNRDGVRDLVYMDSANNWNAVEANLRPVETFPKALSFPTFVTVPALPDNQPPLAIQLPGTTQTGIVAQFSNRAGFMIFDDRLRPLAVWDEGLSGEFSLMPRGRFDDLVWATFDHLYFFRLEAATKFDFTLFGKWFLCALAMFAALYWLYAQIRQRYQRIIDRCLQFLQGIEIGACILQPSGQIAQINQQAKKILGLGDQELRERQIHEVLAGTEYVELRNFFNNGVTNGALARQSCILHETNKEKEIEVLRAGLDLFGERNRLEVLLLRDVTAQHAARKTTSWAKTVQKLAHDLKTPLSSILMAAEHLRREHKTAIPEQPDNGYLDHIHAEATRMLKHAIGLVKVAELEEPKFEPWPANDFLTAAAATFAPTFGERIEFKKDLEENLPLIFVDAKQIRIVLNNLLDNAIAAILSCRENGVLTLRSYLVTALPDSEGNAPQFVTMEIHDSGCGISPEILQSINEQKLFVTTKPGGTGFGLVQAQQIIADHHGQFEIKSTPGVGTIVSLTIPTYREV